MGYKRMTPQQAEQEARAAGYIPLEPYPGRSNRAWVIPVDEEARAACGSRLEVAYPAWRGEVGTEPEPLATASGGWTW